MLLYKKLLLITFGTALVFPNLCIEGKQQADVPNFCLYTRRFCEAEYVEDPDFSFAVVQQPPSRPGPHYRGFTIALRPTTLGRTPLDEWSARRSDLSTWQHATVITRNIRDAGCIRTRSPSKRAAADRRLRPRGHWECPRTSVQIDLLQVVHYLCIGLYFMEFQVSRFVPKNYLF